MIEGLADRIAKRKGSRATQRRAASSRNTRYGSERNDWGADAKPSHDCRVFKGELHVVGCDAEGMPHLPQPASCCDCPYDDRA